MSEGPPKSEVISSGLEGEALRALVARYLDGAASAAERAGVERALVDDAAVAHALAEELLVRHLLRHLPPEALAPELLGRFEAAVLAELSPEEAPGWLSQAVSALSWTVRGPALSVANGPDLVRLGLASLRPAPRAPWWRRVWRLR